MSRQISEQFQIANDNQITRSTLTEVLTRLVDAGKDPVLDREIAQRPGWTRGVIAGTVSVSEVIYRPVVEVARILLAE